MAVTMKQVAERAGVSTPVVSTVLSGATGTIGVSAAKAQRVREVVLELGYRADWKAASLRRGRTRLIGMLSATHLGTRDHNPLLLRGIEDTLVADHCHLTFASSLPGKDEMLRDGRFDGCLIDYIVEPEQIAAVRAVRLPCVIVNAPPRDGVPSVRLDQRGSAGSAVRHLVSRGHRRLCFVGLDDRASASNLVHRDTHRDRLDGFLAAARAAGLTDDAAGPTSAGGSGRDGGVWVERLPELYYVDDRSPRRVVDLPSVRALAAGDPAAPTAFVGYDVPTTVSLREGLAMAGLSCPGDYSLVSLHDTKLFELLAPAVTSMRAEYDRLGERAAARLLAQIDLQSPARRRPKRGRPDAAPPDGHPNGSRNGHPNGSARAAPDSLPTPPSDEVMPFELVERGSVAPPPARRSGGR